MDLIKEIVSRAQANKQRIVLPEGTEERTLKAANQILTDEVADLILLGNRSEIEEAAKKWGLGNISKATIIDPATSPKKEEYAQLLFELRKKKGMTIEEAHQKVQDPLFYGCLMIKAGDADGQLAGARNTTGNVLQLPALQIIKTAPGHHLRFRCNVAAHSRSRTTERTAFWLWATLPSPRYRMLGPVGSDCRLCRPQTAKAAGRYRKPEGCPAALLHEGFCETRSGRQSSGSYQAGTRNGSGSQHRRRTPG